MFFLFLHAGIFFSRKYLIFSEIYAIINTAPGMTPITKNSVQMILELIFISKTILVRNILNQQIGCTYPKRARGLVKHRRAEWLDSESIRLLYAQKGEISMSPKAALISAINEMSDTQIHALLVFLDTFQNHPAQVSVPDAAPAESAADPVRAGMMQTLQERMNALDYSSPNAENVLKELKDMLNMLLRV